MTPQELLARALYQARPIIYCSWNNAEQEILGAYEGQARRILDELADVGYVLASDADGGGLE